MVVAVPDPSPIEFLQLVGDPLRWQLLSELARSDRRVNELTALSGRPQNVVSYHLRELRTAGLVSARQSSADGRDSYYRVDLARCARLLSATAEALHPALGPVAAPPTPHAGRGERRRRVLFLCTGNSARSQMAEALLERQSAGTVDASSAGSRPKPLHPEAIRVMRDRGIDISGNRTKHLDELVSEPFDVVVTVCDRVREVCPEFPSQPSLVHWSVPDPAQEAAGARSAHAVFERTAAELETRVRFLLPQLRDPSTT